MLAGRGACLGPATLGGDLFLDGYRKREGGSIPKASSILLQLLVGSTSLALISHLPPLAPTEHPLSSTLLPFVPPPSACTAVLLGSPLRFLGLCSHTPVHPPPSTDNVG